MKAADSKESLENKWFRKVIKVEGGKQKDFKAFYSLKPYVFSPFIVYQVLLGWKLSMTLSSQIYHMPTFSSCFLELTVCEHTIHLYR